MQHPITIMGSTALSPRSPKKVTFASRTNPANHAAKVKTVAQPYPIMTRPFITIRLVCSLVWVYHTTSRKNTPICQNFPFFLRTCVPAMYGRTQRLARNAQHEERTESSYQIANLIPKQKAGHHRYGDTLPLLVLAYRSAYSRRRTSCKQKTYPNPFS